MVRNIPQSKILALRQQNQLVWETYFRSVDAIINTVLEVSSSESLLTYFRSVDAIINTVLEVSSSESLLTYFRSVDAIINTVLEVSFSESLLTLV